ncbi:hypothetical protein AGDE_13603 [Angomonas deanei]|uniref:Uncharacterized protein n=1 Tax=Angomonas deanei TaxID=59799 RepID=A0A7G2CHH3_9TRYP|nr:hypothetical protein AGDE_13603 [Angomonas deanei]CAD2218421.1 hypothetical protein, conserved [Angomonas deanei]|eukprot:EPY22100.1 hypothetical protein AGDE_13603 [Angomonas deanei]
MYFRQLWQSGIEAQHTDELINSNFRSFAPYAGADQQAISFTKQTDYDSQATLTVEETGDFMISGAHSRGGMVAFSSYNEVVSDLLLRIPIAPRLQPDEETKQTSTPVVSGQESGVPLTPLPRFHLIGSGHRMLYGLPRVPRRVGGEEMGVVELDVNIPSLWYGGRHALGVRLGSAAVALSGQPTLLPDLQASRDGEQRSLLTEEERIYINHTLDAAYSFPIRMGTAEEATNHNSDSSSAAVAPPLVVNVGLRHPLGPGDTLAAISIENDRLVRFARHFMNGDNTRNNKTQRKSLVESDNGSYHLPLYGERNGLTHFSPQPYLFKLLVVQTVATRTFVNDTSMLGDLDVSRSSSRQRGARLLQYSNQTLAQLPTLVAAHFSANEEQVSFTAASIFHDGEADVEVAVGIDATPVTGISRPTRLQVGWNKTGRWALAISTLFYEKMRLTLGMHVVPGEGAKFGLEVKV